jgi:hypothetical protein
MRPLCRARQCAAVMSTSWCGLCTTLAVQKCVPRPPLRVVENSAPTAGVPPNGSPAALTGGAGAAFLGIEFIAEAIRRAILAAPWGAGADAATGKTAIASRPAAQVPALAARRGM